MWKWIPNLTSVTSHTNAVP